MCRKDELTAPISACRCTAHLEPHLQPVLSKQLERHCPPPAPLLPASGEEPNAPDAPLEAAPRFLSPSHPAGNLLHVLPALPSALSPALPSKRTWHGNTSYHIACTATARGQVGASLTPVPRVTAGASQLPTRQDPRTSHSLFSPHRP